MATQEITAQATATASKAATATRSRLWFRALSVVALLYAFIAGLKTIAEFDLGWQMATARWILHHHQIPSVDVLSFTAAGQPWIYPVGAGLIFYAIFLVGGYPLLSWLAAAACAAVMALLRRGSLISSALAILAVPLVALRTTPRAEMFTIVLFAATLSLLWEQHQHGTAKLWILPLLMAAWVNVHPGFIVGLALLGSYLMLEALELPWPNRRAAAVSRLQRAWPFLLATVAATLLNPWGWKVFQVVARQEAAMGAHSQLILEWAPIPLNWTRITSGLSPLDPDGFYLLLLVAVLVVVTALWRRQIGAAILVAAAIVPPLRHMRFTALFAIVVVIVGGSVLSSLAEDAKPGIANSRLRSATAIALVLCMSCLAAVRSARAITNRTYLSETNLVTFGTGLSWWFPQKAVDFVEKENLPGQIFTNAEAGAYLAYRLGPRYPDYIDGRAIPFGTDLMVRSIRLKVSPPNSPLWEQEAQRYNINVILLPTGRFNALQFFPVLKDFCESDAWRPVYLDEVSVVFLRRQAQTEDLIRRLQINCSTVPLPLAPIAGNRTEAFNQWANAAAVLRALGRKSEAVAAINQALTIFPDNAYLHFERGHASEEDGRPADAERDYLQATKLEPNLVAPWSALAEFYQNRGRMPEAIDAWQRAADASRWPWEPLINLGFANLQAHRPKQGLEAFDGAAASVPADSDLSVDATVHANIAHGRARAWFYLGDLRRAIRFEEEAARLIPDPNLWLQLADLYDRAGRPADASRARAQAMSISATR